MTEYKTMTLEKNEEMLELACYAFNLEKTEKREKEFKELCAVSACYGAFQNETLMSQIIVRPMEVYLHGKPFSMGGIGFVSSYPENRGAGDIAQLMKLSLEKMNEQGQLLSYLAPFSYPFYRKYGYEQCFDDIQYTIDVSELPKVQKTPGMVRRVKWEDVKETMRTLYTERYETSVGPLKRSEWDWEFLMMSREDSAVALYLDEEGEAQGYLIYSFKGQAVGTFVLQEMVYLSHEAFKGLWNFVASHKATFHTYRYKTGEHEKMAYLLENPRIKQELVPSMMARIVNIQQFLMAYPFKERAPQTFYLKVEDTAASWNTGVWKVELHLTDRKVTKITDEQEIFQESILSGTIQAWTQVFMNYRTIEELHFFERILGDKHLLTEFAERIPAGVPVLYDYF